ncbi:MAG: thioredoxin family protein [Candidatus Onthomonas sp.]
MALFNFGKKKEEEKGAAACCGKTVDGICCVQVLGAGCKTCHEQYETVRAAVKNLGLTIEVEYITDFRKIMEYGVMSMPAIVVNEQVVSSGKVLKTAEVEKLLRRLEG